MMPRQKKKSIKWKLHLPSDQTYIPLYYYKSTEERKNGRKRDANSPFSQYYTGALKIIINDEKQLTICGGKYTDGTRCSTTSKLLHNIWSIRCNGPSIILTAGRTDSTAANKTPSAVSKLQFIKPFRFCLKKKTMN